LGQGSLSGCVKFLAKLNLIESYLNFVKSTAKRGINGGVTAKRGGDAGPKKAVVEAGEEQSGTETSVGDAVTEAFGQSLTIMP
jgi:hypothetical protein